MDRYFGLKMKKINTDKRLKKRTIDYYNIDEMK